MNWDEMLRRLGVIRGVGDLEYGVEGLRALGVARLGLECDDISALHSS
jgi:hypothetical protein